MDGISEDRRERRQWNNDENAGHTIAAIRERSVKSRETDIGRNVVDQRIDTS